MNETEIIECALSGVDQAIVAAIAAWIEDEARVWCGHEPRVAEAEAARLRAAVRRCPRWREAYLANLQGLWGRVGVARSDVALTTKIAATEAELAWATVLQDLPMPHLGRHVARVARMTSDGIHWSLRGAPTEPVVTPYGTSELQWRDDVLGVMTTTIEEIDLDPIAVLENGLASLKHHDHPRALAVALVLANDLAGPVCDGVAAAAAAFDDGRLDTEVDERWAALALSMQLRIEDFATRADDAELSAALQRAEDALAPHASALLLLDDDLYEDLTRPFDIDPEAWHGIRERMDRDVPRALVEAALDELAERRSLK